MNRVFAKLGNEKRLHEYCDVMWQLLGIVIDFINADGVSLKLSWGRNFNPVCEMLRRTDEGYRRCHEEDLRNSRAAGKNRKECVYTCHAGFTEIVVPLFDDGGNYLGCMTAGQFHLAGTPRPNDAKFAELASGTGLDADTLRRNSGATVTLTREQVSGIIGYLKLMGELISGTYSNLMFMEQVNSPDRISLVQEYIHENYMQPLSVGSVARKFYFSPNYFSRVFRRVMGTGFNSYVNCYRVEKAREMLWETELSVSEIALLCGFGSISQFNRVFREVVRQTPREFRTAKV